MALKFGRHIPHRQSRLAPWKNFENGAWRGSRDPVDFWELNANFSKVAKDMDLKFGMRGPLRESPDIDAK